ncbi:MAG: hypothetical protein RI949_230, partial [Pseudomonadota bacterium]
FTLCESTRLRSDFKVGCEEFLLTMIGLSHAEDVSVCSFGRVSAI